MRPLLLAIERGPSQDWVLLSPEISHGDLNDLLDRDLSERSAAQCSAAGNNNTPVYGMECRSCALYQLIFRVQRSLRTRQKQNRWVQTTWGCYSRRMNTTVTSD
jgi:hypothetical protein